MSLAIYAAPFNENEDNMNDNMINRKKQTHNKTQKRFTKESFDTNKVNNVLNSIHQNSKVDEDGEGENLGDFHPPPKPESSGVKKTIATEQMMNMTNNNNQHMFQTLGKPPSPMSMPIPNDENNPEGDLDLNNFNSNYGSQTEIEEYYKKFIPNYHVNKPKYPQNYNTIDSMNSNSNSNSNENNLLMQKLNYMINLLEQQQDERTNNVTEEVVLYSFLGIFIIFIVDSFARVGKYVR